MVTIRPSARNRILRKGYSTNSLQLWKDLKRNQPEIPQHSEIINEVLASILTGLDASEIKDRFNEIFTTTLSKVYKMYQEYERNAGKVALVRTVAERLPTGSAMDLAVYLGDRFNGIDEYCLSLGQGRKSRAGATIEDVVEKLFVQLGYEFDTQPLVNGKPDFIFPSKAQYEENANQTIVFTTKRTARERWRQIITEGARGAQLFLGTIDPDITSHQLSEMNDHRVWVVVPQDMKNKIPDYKNAPNVIPYREFFDDWLDPAMERWKRRGII